METAKEVFDRYFNQDFVLNSQEDFERLVILPAMEAYAAIKEQTAFEAARQNTGTIDGYVFENFSAYQQSSAKAPAAAPQVELATVLEDIAETIIHQYIPTDKTVNEFSFDFGTEEGRYKVIYQKDAEGYWNFKGYQLLE
ncbi:hypothetical protein GCM10027037_14300 [Mucilaginibacter koreensis]